MERFPYCVVNRVYQIPNISDDCRQALRRAFTARNMGIRYARLRYQALKDYGIIGVGIISLADQEVERLGIPDDMVSQFKDSFFIEYYTGG